MRLSPAAFAAFHFYHKLTTFYFYVGVPGEGRSILGHEFGRHFVFVVTQFSVWGQG